MRQYAIILFVISLIAAVFGFAGIADGAAGIAQVLFFVFMILAVGSFIASMLYDTGKPKPAPLRPEHLVRIDELEAAFPLGRCFDYLGRKCRVTGHWRWRMAGMYDLEAHAELAADYVDKCGVIRSMTFTHKEAMQLAKELPA